MIVAQPELDAILDRRVRKRVLELPVRYRRQLGEGDRGAWMRCPMRVGGVYGLVPPVPFARFLERAERHEPRKRAVLWLVGRVERWEPKRVTITVREVERQGELWLVSFIRGEEAEVFNDKAVYLAPDGGFTTVASRQSVPGDPEYLAPLAEDLARARLAAREKRLTPAQVIIARMKADAESCRDVMVTVKAGNRARLIAHQLQKLQAEVALDDSATLDTSDRAAAECPAADQGEDQLSGAASAPAQPGE